MNPTMNDEEQAYDRGLREGIALIGEIVNKQPEAKALINAVDQGRRRVSGPPEYSPGGKNVFAPTWRTRNSLPTAPVNIPG
ncbi:Uncharacterised protein [Leclercia adecarboxylata]|uniref:Uncharacterized protein n=1 Tax=Leclercia adecarboxylata TaxID=83655 RepID=A0A4U9IMA7_9ENTR|nr:Uncharacterised protein [Leclercia adecarboxylata]